MGYKRAADGVAKKGKTDGENLGNDGPKVSATKLVHGGGGKRNIDMKTMGRGLAKVAAQKRG